MTPTHSLSWASPKDSNLRPVVLDNTASLDDHDIDPQVPARRGRHHAVPLLRRDPSGTQACPRDGPAGPDRCPTALIASFPSCPLAFVACSPTSFVDAFSTHGHGMAAAASLASRAEEPLHCAHSESAPGPGAMGSRGAFTEGVRE